MSSRETPGEPPKPTAAHQRMAVFLGQWTVDGMSRVSPFDPDKPSSTEPLPVKMMGTQRGEWLDGQFFVITRWDERVGNVAFRGMWVMGYDARLQAYAIHLFDDAGSAVPYRATVEGDVWTFTGEAQRATFELTDGGATMHQRWWIKDAGAWVPLCDVRATRR